MIECHAPRAALVEHSKAIGSKSGGVHDSLHGSYELETRTAQCSVNAQAATELPAASRRLWRPRLTAYSRSAPPSLHSGRSTRLSINLHLLEHFGETVPFASWTTEARSSAWTAIGQGRCASSSRRAQTRGPVRYLVEIKPVTASRPGLHDRKESGGLRHARPMVGELGVHTPDRDRTSPAGRCGEHPKKSCRRRGCESRFSRASVLIHPRRGEFPW